MNTPPNIKSQKLKYIDNDDSPNFFPNTQDSLEDIEVSWNWNSPQAVHNKRRKIKKQITLPSPKIPLRRYPSNNQPSNVEELHEELKALQQQLAQPDDEQCLCVSPQQEQEFKSIIIDKEDQLFAEFDDMFNDSINEQLIVCSQKLESKLSDNNGDVENKKCNSVDVNNLINKHSDTISFSDNDEWDDILSTFEEKNLEIKQNTTDNNIETKNKIKSTTNSNDNSEDFIKTPSGKVELHRTKSFELEISNETKISKNVLEEIERKRLEALAKLEAKRKQELNTNSSTSSPLKCSQQEIEMKRQQALAKLEAKRIQENVERNRVEALKRLQSNRQKNATLVKSTLSKLL